VDADRHAYDRTPPEIGETTVSTPRSYCGPSRERIMYYRMTNTPAAPGSLWSLDVHNKGQNLCSHFAWYFCETTHNEGMTYGSSILAYLVFGLDRTSVEGMARPISTTV
jgi:hypothetical protein